MSAVTPAKEPADFGRLGTALFAGLCILIGAWVGRKVYFDGRHDFSNDVDNPLSLFLGSHPYLETITLLSVLLVFILVLAAVWKTWSLDRMVIIFCAFLMTADIVPGLSTAMGIMIILSLVQRTLRTGDAKWPLAPITFPILLVLMAYFTTFLQVEKPLSSFMQFMLRGPYIVLGIFLPLVINTRKRLEQLLDFLFLALMVSLFVELLQGIASSATGMIITFGPTESSMFETPWGIQPRLTGLMTHPNRHSNVASTCGVLMLWFLTRPKSMITPQRRALLIVLFILTCLGVFFSWSRSGWLSFAVVAAIVPFVRWPHLSPLFIAAGGAVIFAGLSTGVLQEAFQFVRDLNRSSSDFRWHIDHIAGQAFMENPWMGIGVTGEKDYFNAYELAIHSTPLQVMAYMGAVGMVAFGSLLLTVVWMLYKVITTALDPRIRDLGIAMSIASVVPLVQGSFGEMLWLKFLWAYIGMLGCLYVINREDLARRRLTLAEEHLHLESPSTPVLT